MLADERGAALRAAVAVEDDRAGRQRVAAEQRVFDRVPDPVANEARHSQLRGVGIIENGVR